MDGGDLWAEAHVDELERELAGKEMLLALADDNLRRWKAKAKRLEVELRMMQGGGCLGDLKRYLP